MDYIKDINAPYISAGEQTICEGRLTLKEIYEALSNLPSNKTPGNDGLNREFYLAFFDLLGNEVLASLNYSYQLGKNKRYIKNWRPISLLNVDTKILSKALASRLKKVINTLISPVQTAYVPGRYIGDSVRLISDLLEYTDRHNISGFLLTADMEKAFNSLDHQLLIAALKKYGLGSSFIQ